MDLTFQVPMHYCSSQHWTLLLSPVTSTAECCLCLDSSSSFFLELFLHWSPVAYWGPTDLGSSSFSVLSFRLFILSWVSQGRNTEVVFHSLLQWTTFSQNSSPWAVPPQETLRYSSGSVCGVSGSWCPQGCLNPSSLWQLKCLILNSSLFLLLSYSKIYYCLYPWGTGLWRTGLCP